MIRRFAAIAIVAVLALGAAFAEEVKGTFVKYADGKLTIKVDDKEKEFTVPADLKIKRKGKDGNETETNARESLEKMSKFMEKAPTKPTLILDVEKRRGQRLQDGIRQEEIREERQLRLFLV